MESSNLDTIESIMERYAKEIELGTSDSLDLQGSQLSLAAEKMLESQDMTNSMLKRMLVINYKDIPRVIPIIVFLLLSACELYLLIKDNTTHSPILAKRRSYLPILLLIPALPIIHFVITPYIFSTQWRDILIAILGVLAVMKWNSLCGDLMDKMELSLIARENRIKEEAEEAEAQRIEQERKEREEAKIRAEEALQRVKAELKEREEAMARDVEAVLKERVEKARQLQEAHDAALAKKREERELARKEEKERLERIDAAERARNKGKILAFVAKTEKFEAIEQEIAEKREVRVMNCKQRKNELRRQRFVEGQRPDRDIEETRKAIEERREDMNEKRLERVRAMEDRNEERLERARAREARRKVLVAKVEAKAVMKTYRPVAKWR